MTTTPEFMPVLSHGAHNNPKEGACIMELASFLNGEEWSDHPSCTHPVLAEMARSVNDKLGDGRRQELLPLLPRLMGTASDDRGLSVRLAVWCARQVAHLNPDDRVRVAIESAIAWCDNPCKETAYATANAANAAYAAAYATDAANAAYDATYAAAYAAAGTAANAAHATANAAYAAYATAYAAYATAYAANAADNATDAANDAANAAAYSAHADCQIDLVQLLTGLIDEYDRLTGRVDAPEVTADDLARCAALAKAGAL